MGLETVLRTILLGSMRKALSLIDPPGAQPVRSLRYFEPLLAEVEGERFPAAYWQHLARRLQRCEERGQQDKSAAAAWCVPGRKRNRQRLPTPPRPLPAAVRERKERRDDDGTFFPHPGKSP